MPRELVTADRQQLPLGIEQPRTGVVCETREMREMRNNRQLHRL